MGGKARPRPWIPLDVDNLEQDTIVELGDTYTAAGQLAFIALMLEARKQASAGGEPRLVRLRYAALAKKARTDAATAVGIIRLAADLGLLAIVSDDGQRFEARMLKAEPWEPKDPGGAARQAAHIRSLNAPRH